jgi:hypothetical protein
VDARVIESSVEVRSDAESTTFNPVVRYEYVVDHVRYLGDRVAFSQRIFVNSRENAEKVVQKYPLGAEVKVFYNPSNPAYAVLEPGMGHNAPVQAGIGLLLIMIGLSVWRHAKRGQEAVL